MPTRDVVSSCICRLGRARFVPAPDCSRTSFLFFFKYRPPPEIYPLPLPDALPITKCRAHNGAQRRIRIGVRHYEQDVLGSAARLHPLPMLAAERVDMASRARRADETDRGDAGMGTDRKSTRLNSSHSQISYAVFCL